MRIGDAERLELIGALAGALQALTDDEEGIEALFSVPLPEELLKQLRQRDAFVLVMEELPRAERERMRTLYREAVWRVADRDDEADVPVLPEVKEHVAGVLARLRSAAILDPEIETAVRVEVPAWSMLW